MCEFSPPVAFWSAGARISASSAGPSRGTAIWRGVREVSIARRRASVSSAPAGRARVGDGIGIGIGSATALAMLVLLCSGGRGELGAGAVEVHVVEGGAAGRDLGHA